MAIVAFHSSFNPILDNDGNPAAGGFLHFLSPGTGDFKSVFTTSVADVPHTNPVELDGNGRKVIFLSGDYDLTIKDILGNTLEQIPNINPDSAGALSGVNLVPNGSFELNTLGDGKTPDSFTLTEYAGSTTTLDSDSAIGALALKAVSTGSGGSNVISADFFEVAGGDVLTVSFWLKSTVVDVRNLFQIHWYDSAKSLISSSTIYDESAANPTTYTRQIVTSSAPATARFAKVQLYAAHPSDATSGTTFMDGVEVIPSSVGGAFASGVKLVSPQVAAPAGWTNDAETVDRVLMFGNTAGATEAGSWTISGISVDNHQLTIAEMPGHNHAASTILRWVSGGAVLTLQTTTGTEFADPRLTITPEGGDTAHPHTMTIGSAWRPNHRVVKQITKD